MESRPDDIPVPVRICGQVREQCGNDRRRWIGWVIAPATTVLLAVSSAALAMSLRSSLTQAALEQHESTQDRERVADDRRLERIEEKIDRMMSRDLRETRETPNKP